MVAIDTPFDDVWECVPRTDRDTEAWLRMRRERHVQLKPSWWFAQRLFNGSARVSYCGVAGLREVAAQLKFDICLIGGLLQHVRYPADVLCIASQAATQIIVSERFLPEVEKTGQPLARFIPSRGNDFIDSWWYLSSAAVTNALDFFGFDRERLNCFKCRQWPVVASAGEGTPLDLDYYCAVFRKR